MSILNNIRQVFIIGLQIGVAPTLLSHLPLTYKSKRKIMSTHQHHKTTVTENKCKHVKTKKMNTTIISIPPCSASTVLKTLHSNNINCQYMGIDQSGRILMEITFANENSSLIQELTTYMEESEKTLQEITKSVNEIIGKRFEGIDKIIREFKRKQTVRKLKMSLLNNEH